MSDTLQEGRDQMRTERIDQIESKNADWCDDCHGYVHAPWCPHYSESSKEVTDQTATTTHQPAARGGGDEPWEYGHYDGQAKGFYINNIPDIPSDFVRVADIRYHGDDDRDEAEARARQIVTEHNQHQALVAERERLERMLAAVVNAHYGLAYRSIGSGDGIPEKEAAEIGRWWLDYTASDA